MPAPAEVTQAPIALLLVDGGGAAWAIPSASVAAIEHFDPASTEPLLDLSAWLSGTPLDASAAARVLVVEASDRRLKVLARGALVLKQLAPSELLMLPHDLADRSELLSHVALVDDEPALLVVSPERLVRARRPPATEPDLTLPQCTEVRPC